MKTKNYKFGNGYFKAYCKTAGQGWEVGVWYAGKQVFVGNFIHRDECTKWWNLMNREIKMFCKKYLISKYGPNGSKAWFGKFFSNHLYNCYYAFLDKVFVKYNKNYKRAVVRDVRKFHVMKKHYRHMHHARAA